MNMATNQQQQTNNGVPSVAASVPAAVPENGSAVKPTGNASNSAVPELAIVQEQLSGTSAVSTKSASATVSDTDIPSGDEDTIEEQFEELNQEFSDNKPVVTPAPVVTPTAGQVPSAVPVSTETPQPVIAPAVAKPAETVPVLATPTVSAEPVASTTAQPQPSGELSLEALDLFVPVQQPVSTPTPLPASAPTGVETVQSPSPAIGENDEQRKVRLRTEYMSEVEKMYTFDENDARAVMLEPEKVLPKQFAKLHTQTVEAAVAGIVQQLPAIIQMTMQTLQAKSQLNKSFYSAWPQLAKSEHVATVRNMMQAYRQQNPQASWDQVVREVGAAAMVSLKLPLTPEMIGNQQTTTVPSVPPVAPVNPGGGMPLNKPTENNPFVKLNADWDTQESIEE